VEEIYSSETLVFARLHGVVSEDRTPSLGAMLDLRFSRLCLWVVTPSISYKVNDRGDVLLRNVEPQNYSALQPITSYSSTNIDIRLAKALRMILHLSKQRDRPVFLITSVGSSILPQSACCFTLKKEPLPSSETYVKIHLTASCHIPEDSVIQVLNFVFKAYIYILL
jgi:hypothetical protein